MIPHAVFFIVRPARFSLQPLSGPCQTFITSSGLKVEIMSEMLHLFSNMNLVRIKSKSVSENILHTLWGKSSTLLSCFCCVGCFHVLWFMTCTWVDWCHWLCTHVRWETRAYKRLLVTGVWFALKEIRCGWRVGRFTILWNLCVETFVSISCNKIRTTSSTTSHWINTNV